MIIFKNVGIINATIHKKRQYETNKNICILYHRHTMLIYLIYKDSLIREEKKNQCFWTKD